MDSKERIDQLTDQLKEAGYRYYVLDDPTMEDYEYDRLYRELEELESAHPELARADSPTKRVGGEVLSQFEKVSHPVPLMSLQDVFSMEELNDFLEKCGIFRRAEDRWPFRGAGICGREIRPGRDPGRRYGRGGRDGKPENHPLHPHDPDRRTLPAYRPG